MVLNCPGMRFGPVLSLLGLTLTVACSPASDIGNPCRLLDSGIPCDPANDCVSNGDAFCQNLVCLRPGGSTLDAGWGFCSNSLCTPDTGAANLGTASQDCNSSSTGLVCGSLTLDPSFVKQIDAEDGGAALLAQYLSTTYCTCPPGQPCVPK